MKLIKDFLQSKPIVTLFIFVTIIFVLSRDPFFQKADLMLSFDKIIAKFPNLSVIFKKEKITEKEKNGSNLFLNANRKSKPLDSFFKNLHKVNTSKQRDFVKIIHFGDSILWGDTLSGNIRDSFIQKFGNGGRGLLPIVYKFSDYKLDGISQFFSKMWKISNLETMQHRAFKLGLTLRRYQTGHYSCWSTIKFKMGEDISSFTLLHNALKTAVKLTISLTNKKIINRTLKAGEVNSRIELPLNASKINILSGPKNTFWGIIAKRDRGVIYSPVIRKGILGADLLNIHKSKFEEQFHIYNANLLILQFGKNGSGWNKFNLNNHLDGIIKIIKIARKINPQISILLIGPGARLNRFVYPLRAFPNIHRIIEAQKQVAIEYNCAFYDTFTALGGTIGMKKMVQQKLALSDFVHLTKKGGALLAKKIFHSLMTEYKDYLIRKKADSAGIFQHFQRKENKKREIKSALSSINFDTVSFIFFLSVVFLLNWLLYKTSLLRILMLLIASWFFYMSWNPIFIVLIIISTIIDYIIGFLIYQARNKNRMWLANVFLFISLASNLGLLFFFKYFNLLADMINQLSTTGSSIAAISLILPVGISFYTFQTMSYSLDIKRGLLKPIKSFPRFALFVSFFPQLVAGPIVRARDFLPQLNGKPIYSSRAIQIGFFLILTGLFKKIVISDFIAVNFVNRVFGQPELYTPLENLMAVYGFGLQIFSDFSGYSDIAIGSAALIGFKLPLNFNSPYKAHNLQDFWHRWHISLSTWLRDYLYIPLGGSKKGKIRTYINLLLTMLLGGLWHGAAYRFIIWGALHGFGLSIVRFLQRFRYKRKPLHKQTKLGYLFGWFLTFNFVSFAWIFFRAENLDAALKMIGRISGITKIFPNIFSFDTKLMDIPGNTLTYIKNTALYLPNFSFILTLIFIGGYFLHFVPEKVYQTIKSGFVKIPALLQATIMAIFAIIFYKTASSDIVPFIYFQF